MEVSKHGVGTFPTHTVLQLKPVLVTTTIQMQSTRSVLLGTGSVLQSPKDKRRKTQPPCLRRGGSAMSCLLLT